MRQKLEHGLKFNQQIMIPLPSLSFVNLWPTLFPNQNSIYMNLCHSLSLNAISKNIIFYYVSKKKKKEQIK